MFPVAAFRRIHETEKPYVERKLYVTIFACAPVFTRDTVILPGRGGHGLSCRRHARGQRRYRHEGRLCRGPQVHYWGVDAVGGEQAGARELGEADVPVETDRSGVSVTDDQVQSWRAALAKTCCQARDEPPAYSAPLQPREQVDVHMGGKGD